MLNKNFWMLIFSLVLSACAAPATEVVQNDPTLPPPAVATQASTIAPPTIESQPTDVAAVQPTLSPTQPATVSPTEEPQVAVWQGTFVNMEVPSSGSFTLDPTTNTLTLNADFTTQPGPDLFVILSGANDVSLDFHSFSTIVSNSPLQYLGPLKTTAGVQTYGVPTGTDFSQYRTVVVWCKQYSVAFAAALIQ